MSMLWHDLLFMHWPVPATHLRPLIPDALDIDTFEGQAWIGVVPFRMTGVGYRWMPKPKWLADFVEINVRTYVVADNRPGVWFFSLDATQALAVWAARWRFRLPYYHARMQCEDHNGAIHYASARTHRGAPAASFRATYRPTNQPTEAQVGTLEHWLTERYCLYAARSSGAVYRGEIHHGPWPLQEATAHVEHNTMTEPLGITLPDAAPLLHFARRLDVFAWPITGVASSA
jgi:hypothetical protein